MPRTKKILPKDKIDFDYTDSPAPPVRHIIIEAIIQDDEYYECVEQALDSLRTLGHASPTKIKIIENNVAEAAIILNNRHMLGMLD